MLSVVVHVKEQLDDAAVQALLRRVSECMKETGLLFETQFFLYNEETMRIGVVPGRSAFMNKLSQP